MRRFYYVNYFDSFEGGHPCVFVPARRPHEQFGSIEDVCNYLLSHGDLREFVGGKTGPRGKGVFVFFDEESERRAAEVGLEVALPAAELRHRLDSKIITTQLGEEAGVPSVPNVLGRAAGYDELLALAASGGLGDDLVVQTPYGDSGKTTFFVRGERDWNRGAKEMARQELKVMRRIEPKAVAVEACITRHGTVIGPLMTDLTGHPELTRIAAAGAAMTSSPARCRLETASSRWISPAGSAIGWPGRAIAASSRSTTSSTPTATSSTWASSTRA